MKAMFSIVQVLAGILWTVAGTSVTCLPDRVELEGTYPGHLQDVWWDGGTNLWWAHTHHIIRTDQLGRIAAVIEVDGHNAGLQVCDGRLYVAVCKMQSETGGKTTPECHPRINVHDAYTLKLLESHILENIIDRIGSLAILPDGSFVVGCLRPPDISKTQVRFHHLASNYRLLRSMVLDGVDVRLGIETIKYRNGELYLGVYKRDGLSVVIDAGTFVEKRRLELNGCMGLVFGEKVVWCGSSTKDRESGLWSSCLLRRSVP